MNHQLERTIRLTTTLMILLAAVSILLHSNESTIKLSLLVVTYFLIFWMRDYLLKIDLKQIQGIIYLFIQLAIALVIFVWSGSFFAQIYVLILIGEFSLHHSKKLSFLFTFIAYSSSVVCLMVYRNFPEFEDIYLYFPRVIDYVAIFGISQLAQIAFLQQNQLAKDHSQLQLATIELEKNAKLKERTRISREIHDSVGHTLTSAIVGLQTAEQALAKNHYSLALEMIGRTRESIHNGLDEVRNSVHLLEDHSRGPHFQLELVELIEETKKLTNVNIVYEIDPDLSKLSPLVEVTLYRALQEGLTNGIRHGSSTYFRFSLTQHSDTIEFILYNNGKPPKEIIPGFGLNAMKERVEKVAGELLISNKDTIEGVTLTIKIPFHSKSIEGE